MCGIYGYVSLGGAGDLQTLRRMGAALRHRGPDDQGEVVRDDGDIWVGLGHQRLSIMDLSQAAKQPLVNEDQSAWITCNGEIYNFKELREELIRKGHRFTCRSDSEVILHLYEEMGERCVERLDGMFAFALWDGKRRSLFLARDRLGKKPLHYFAFPGGLVFSSEIKGLLKHPKVERRLDFKSLSKYLSYEYVPCPDTIFESVKKLEPGHYLSYRQGTVKKVKYWDFPLDEYAVADRSEERYTDELIELLDRAVRCRLVADVPVGLFLSGGVDSGLVAALAAKSNRDLECFSIGFTDPSFDESPYATQVARALGLRSNLTLFRDEDMLQVVERLPDILDEPLADPSILPLAVLSRFAANKFKVVLSGDGGDEIFAGYQTFQAHQLAAYYQALPAIARSALNRIVASLPVSHRYLSLDFKLKQFLKGVGAAPDIRFFLWRGAFSDLEKRELLRPDLRQALQNHDPYEDIHRYVSESGLTQELEKLLYLSAKLYLQDNNLVTVDRASMASGLEIRSPLLDHHLVEFVSRLPMEFKLRRFATKYLLKKAAERYLPRKLVYRRKQGFGVPLSEWLTGKLKDFMLDYLNESRIRRQGFFDYPVIKRLIDQHLDKRKDNRESLWTLLVFQAWYERYFEGNGAGS